MTVANDIGLRSPLGWRSISPLHRKLGSRAIRFTYPAGGAPTTAAVMKFRYDATTAMDRVVGFCISSAAGGTTGFSVTLNELNTGWQWASTVGGTKPFYVKENIETFVDEVDLTWVFSAAPDVPIYMSFFNFEVSPVYMGGG